MAKNLYRASVSINQKLAKEITSGSPIHYFEEVKIVSPANQIDFQKAIQLKVNEILFQKLSKVLPMKNNEKWYIKKNNGVVLPKFAMTNPNESRNEDENTNIAMVSRVGNTWQATFNIKLIYQYEEIDERTAAALIMHLESVLKDVSKEKTI